MDRPCCYSHFAKVGTGLEALNLQRCELYRWEGGWVITELGNRVSISKVVIPEGQHKPFLNLGSSRDKMHLVSHNPSPPPKTLSVEFCFPGDQSHLKCQ